MSESYKKSYMQEAKPSMGAEVPAGKNRPDDTDTLHAKHTVEQVRQAKEVDESRVKSAFDRQLGRHTDTCLAGDPGRDGGKLGNATTQPEDGVNDTPPSVKFKQ